MVVGLVTDFEMTFTSDLFKIAWQNDAFVFKVSVPNIDGYGPLKNLGQRSRAILALLFSE